MVTLFYLWNDYKFLFGKGILYFQFGNCQNYVEDFRLFSLVRRWTDTRIVPKDERVILFQFWFLFTEVVINYTFQSTRVYSPVMPTNVLAFGKSCRNSKLECYASLSKSYSIIVYHPSTQRSLYVCILCYIFLSSRSCGNFCDISVC